MRFSAPLLTLAGTVGGAAAAVVAYQVTAAGPTSRPVSVSTDPPAPASASLLPCETGWKTHGDTCVRVKQKVVVVHDLPAPAAAPAQTAGVRSDWSGPAGHQTAGDGEATDAENTTENEADNLSGEDAEDGSGHEGLGGDD